MNKYTGKVIEFHILQSFPVSCLNRDDVGSPKTAIIGGVTRARVSSQCWKRQVRLAMHEHEEKYGIHLGIRTKRIAQLLADACVKCGASQNQAELCAKAMAEALTKDTLVFVSKRECSAFAEYAKENNFKFADIKAKDLTKKLEGISKKVINKGLDALDIALFGRMVAQAPDINVQAAAAFSHAISTHKVVPEIDFFTALDDFPSEDAAGSAHMGTLEFNSATYYRYVSLDVGMLAHTLGLEEESEKPSLIKAIEAFIRALFVAIPSARQNTQSAACPWEFAHVFVRNGQRLQVPFEESVRCKSGEGYLAPSIERMEGYLKGKEKMMGSMFGKGADFVWGQNESYSIDDLIRDVSESV